MMRAQIASGRCNRTAWSVSWPVTEKLRSQNCRAVLCKAGANVLVHAASASSVVQVRQIGDIKELEKVARLRAEAFYESDNSRFVESFKKQFTAKEVESLRQRIAPRSGLAPGTECLVALDSYGAVIGGIDVRLPRAATGLPTAGVPEGDATGCYILNVVVQEDKRGSGVGKLLMKAAIQRAVDYWHSNTLYTHVEADNEVAYSLYGKFGFSQHSSMSKYEGSLTLGRLILLCATAEAAMEACERCPA